MASKRPAPRELRCTRAERRLICAALAWDRASQSPIVRQIAACDRLARAVRAVLAERERARKGKAR